MAKRDKSTKRPKVKAGRGKGAGGTPKKTPVPSAKGKKANKAKKSSGEKDPKGKSRAAAKARRLVSQASKEGISKTKRNKYLVEARKLVKGMRSEVLQQMVKTGKYKPYGSTTKGKGKNSSKKGSKKAAGGRGKTPKKQSGNKKNRAKVVVRAGKGPTAKVKRKR